MLSDILRRLDAALMPRCCAFCGAACLDGELAICRDCKADLPYVRNEDPMPPFTRIIAPLRYEFPVDAAIKAMKFRRKMFYLPAFAEVLHDACSQLPDTADALLPVPLHWRRHVLRGFNQSAELCKIAHASTGLPVLNGVARHRATPYQSGLDAEQRRKNLADAFRLAAAPDANHVVIVDDVVTTGATASAIARVLFRGGTRRVSVLAIARA